MLLNNSDLPRLQASSDGTDAFSDVSNDGIRCLLCFSGGTGHLQKWYVMPTVMPLDAVTAITSVGVCDTFRHLITFTASVVVRDAHCDAFRGGS